MKDINLVTLDPLKNTNEISQFDNLDTPHNFIYEDQESDILAVSGPNNHLLNTQKKTHHLPKLGSGTISVQQSIVQAPSLNIGEPILN